MYRAARDTQGATLAYPDLYDVTYNYAGWQLGQPSIPFPGVQLDTDFNRLEDNISAILAFTQNVIRSDGALNNEIVTFDSLSPSLKAAIHTSDTVPAEDSAIAAAASAAEAAASATAAGGSATSAGASAGTATTKAAEAAASATAAASSASSIAAAGYVVGPASAIDNTPAVYSGTTGKTLKTITYAAFKTLLALVKGDVGLGNVDNTADASKPVSTAQAAALALKEDIANKGAANGYAGLDGSGLLLTSVLPALAISSVSVVATQAAMLALTAQTGDIAVRTDLNKSFALSTNSPSTLADWKELLTPTDQVLSVAGLTGAITGAALKTAMTFVKADVGLGSVDNTSDANKPVSTAQATAIGLKANTASPTFTGTVTAPISAVTSAPGTAWNFDGSGSTITVAANSSAALATGAGLIILTDASVTGQTGMYLSGGAVLNLVAQSGSGIFVAPTTTPAANTYSIAHNGTNYAIYNGRAASVTFNLVMLKARASN